MTSYRGTHGGLERFNTHEGELIELGYDLMKIGMTPEAALVFGVSVDLHPLSADAHDSLAEALYELGDVEGAIARYQTAIDVDPDYRHAREMLAKIMDESNVPSAGGASSTE